jgi:vacuolar-type H+-ATPase subunit I/STV1
MIIVRLIDFLRRRLKPVILLSLGLLALLVAGDWLLVGKEHAHTAAEHWFGFWSAFGFFSCVAIIFVSKWFGHLGIMKPEDYYGDD